MRVEILGGLERRRRWSQDDKAWIVEKTLAPGAKVTEVCALQWRCGERGVHLAPTGTDGRAGGAIFCAGADCRGGGNERGKFEASVRR